MRSSADPARADLVEAERLLGEIAVLTARIRGLERKAQAELAAVEAKYGGLSSDKDRLAGLDRDLKSLMRRKAESIFEGGDKVDLKPGLLYSSRETRLVVPGGALERIRELGWTEAIRVAESVDRAVVEAWPPDRRAAVGASSRVFKRYAYEIREAI